MNIAAIAPALTNPAPMPIPATAGVESLEGFGVGEGTKVVIGVKMVALDDIFVAGAELDIVLAGVWVGVLEVVVGSVLGIDA